MPSLDVSELNIVISVLGAFIILYGFFSAKIKQVWFLGEALPAVLFGIVLGPLAAKFLDAKRWGSAEAGQQNAITLGVARVMIGLQLVIAGFQLPAKYQLTRWKEMLLLLVPVMTVMWLCTTACIVATIPNLTLLAALVIGSCVTCTDPILSQAIAKGPFADKYVTRDLREIISSEAGANDGFGFPFLMLAVYLMRHSELGAEHVSHVGVERRSEEVGRLGGGVGVALGNWAVETWLYIVLMSIAYGALVGWGGGKIAKFCLRRKWIDSESYLLLPTARGLFLVGTCGALGTDDLLACFVAGNGLNWDGQFLEEAEKRHDEVNSCVDVLLNFGGFMYIGTIIPWNEFHQPELTGITYPRLFGLGFMVLLFRRIPAILLFYKAMPKACRDVKEALFMGYFGPIGAGAVFYLEHTRHLFPELGEGDEGETNLIRALGPGKYLFAPLFRQYIEHHFAKFDHYSNIGLMILVLSAFLSIASYTGTSILFGAFLAGAFLTYLPSKHPEGPFVVLSREEGEREKNKSPTFVHTFEYYCLDFQQYVLDPLFFSSIGFAIPFLSLWEGQAIWQGIVYTLAMLVGKVLVGGVIPVHDWWRSLRARRWKSKETASGEQGQASNSEVGSTPPGSLTRTPSQTDAIRSSWVPAGLLGMAMVARGEIGLLIIEIGYNSTALDCQTQGQGSCRRPLGHREYVTRGIGDNTMGNERRQSEAWGGNFRGKLLWR